MWRVWVGLLLLATPVFAEENATAYEALRVLGSEFGRDALHQIVSIRGTKGDPQPEKWKIVVEDPQGGGVRELEIADGRIDSDNEADRDVAGSTEGATIDVSRLNLDSSGAYAVASHTAEASHTEFCNSRLHIAHRRARRTDVDCDSSKQVVTSRRHDLHRRDARHGEANGGDVCRGHHGGRRRRLRSGTGNRRHQERETIDQARFQQSTGRSPRNVRESEAVIFRFH